MRIDLGGLALLILIVLFWGDPDLHDKLLNHFDDCTEETK